MKGKEEIGCQEEFLGILGLRKPCLRSVGGGCIVNGLIRAGFESRLYSALVTYKLNVGFSGHFVEYLFYQ